MPSKDPAVLKRANQKYKKSTHGRARINVTMGKWRQTKKGKTSVAASGRVWRQTAEYKASQVVRVRVRRQQRKAWLREIKSKLSCVKCGFNKHPAALQFHHLENKVDGVTKLVCNTSKSYEFIRLEMAKCEVLCANCHLILHDEEFNDRVRARDTTRGQLPNLRRNEPSPNRGSSGSKLGIRFGKDRSNGQSDVNDKYDHKGSHSTLCE